MIITKKSLPRRTFLRGMGVSLALPFLDSMVPALAAVTQSAKPTLRTSFIYIPNGVNMSKWTPGGNDSSLELSPTLGPLEPFREQVTVLSNLDSDPAENWGLGGGDHARTQPAWLSASHPKRAEAFVRAGTTIDQLIAQEIGADSQLRSLEVAVERTDLAGACADAGYGCVYNQTISWRSATAPLPMENNPRVVFERLFGVGANTAERTAHLRRTRSILDTIPQEIAGLAKVLGGGDRRRVDEYLYAIREVEQRIQRAEAPKRDVLVPDRPEGIPDSFEEHCKLMFDLQALAFQADVTRVSSFLIGQEFSMRTYPEIGVPDPHHSTSHHGQNPEKLAKLAKVDLYHVQMLAHFLERLKATPDGDGNLLDHSLIMYGAGLADGNVHAHVDLPTVIVGGAAGRLKGNRHLRSPKATPMANLLVSLVHLVGAPVESIGDSTGPLVGFQA